MFGLHRGSEMFRRLSAALTVGCKLRGSFTHPIRRAQGPRSLVQTTVVNDPRWRSSDMERVPPSSEPSEFNVGHLEDLDKRTADLLKRANDAILRSQRLVTDFKIKKRNLVNGRDDRSEEETPSNE
jgi:hypothetical protein